MVTIERIGNDVTLRVLGSHCFWAFKREIRFSADQIASVGRPAPDLRPPWLRAPGTYLPWVLCAGTYYGTGRKEFWDRTPRGETVQIDLRQGPFTRIVVDVADANRTIGELRAS